MWVLMQVSFHQVGRPPAPSGRGHGGDPAGTLLQVSKLLEKMVGGNPPEFIPLNAIIAQRNVVAVTYMRTCVMRKMEEAT